MTKQELEVLKNKMLDVFDMISKIEVVEEPIISFDSLKLFGAEIINKDKYKRDEIVSAIKTIGRCERLSEVNKELYPVLFEMFSYISKKERSL